MHVVPVQICHPDSSKVLDTYAMLDNCSQGTFVKEEIIEALGITGADARVTVTTLNREISQMSEGSRIIGQTKLDKGTKSIHQAGTTS